VDSGVLPAHEGATSRLSTVLWNALGGGLDDLRPEVYKARLHAGDTLLLCTDGLPTHLPDGDIQALPQAQSGELRAAMRLTYAWRAPIYDGFTQGADPTLFPLRHSRSAPVVVIGRLGSDDLRSTPLPRFVLLYAAMYAAFGVASPFLPAFIRARGLISGGRVPMPGEAARVHHGVRLLGALPECRRHVLEVLRQALEESVLSIQPLARHRPQ
jgi:Magnesium chelatase, subunit ChlI